MFRSALIAVFAALALPASAAAVPQTWVSGTGDDANAVSPSFCSLSSPCKTFATAITVTDSGGEIDALNPGNFGPVTITKSLTLDGSGVNASVMPVAATPGITITAGAGANVVINDLSINGLATGTDGISIQSAGSVRVENSDIQGWLGSGIDDRSSTATRVDVYDTSINNNSGDGVVLAPPAGGSGRISLENDSIAANACGVVATSFGIPASPSFGSNCGVNTSGTASGAATVIASNSSIVGNSGVGVLANGSPVIDYLSNDSIRGNGIGLQELASGQIIEIGTNSVQGNGTNGSPTSTLSSAPTGVSGGTGPSGEVELITCKAVKAKKKKKVQKCTGKLVSSPVKVKSRGLHASATLSGGGTVYGVGTITLGAGSAEAVLSPRGHLKPGHYVLTLRRGHRVIGKRTVVVG